jgi:hypothetical protein
MNFDPQNFFISLMDFFSILLPGALLSWLLMGEVGPIVLVDRSAKLNGARAWAAFLFASSLFGHLVFLLGWRLAEFYRLALSDVLSARVSPLQSIEAAFGLPGGEPETEPVVTPPMRSTS